MTGGVDARGSFDDLAVGQIDSRFVVPDYQRGYRWGPTEVRQLLDDILGAEDEQRYYLQPVVVVRDGETYQLVDGQQRLTTLYLIMKFLQERVNAEHAPRFSLRYATRSGSAAYLDSPTVQGARDNADFHHMRQAHDTIRSWAKEHNDADLSRLAQDLRDKVRILWFEAPGDVSGEELFLRLNNGRIALTDAELVKALLLDRVGPDRAAVVAAQWDSFERDLRDPGVWAFIARGRPDANHIGLLLDVVADRLKPPQEPRPAFHTFTTIRAMVEALGPQAFWDEVVQLHSLALGWFTDQDLYHHVGYLVTSRVQTFGHLAGEARGTSKAQWVEHLRSMIAGTIPPTLDDLLKLGYDRRNQRRTLERALLLMNVETVRLAGRERFPFADHQFGDPNRVWSLEHIRPQQAGALREDARREWLQEHAAILGDRQEADPEQVAELRTRVEGAAKGKIGAEVFEELQRDVLAFLDGEEFDLDELHGITNLALLLREQNSALGNSAFQIKRRRIIDLDRRGQYVPACTRNLFLKYYTPDTPGLYDWGCRDREGYRAAIERVLYPSGTVAAGAGA